jgi:hypothetical protein
MTDQARSGGAQRARLLAQAFAALVILVLIVMFLWDHEPDPIDVVAVTQERTGSEAAAAVTGATTVATLVEVASTLLDKRGGYLSNDLLPPGLLMDNVPNWEFGVLTQVRDMAKSLRNDFSRSQTQSTEDPDLAVAEPQFNFDSASWMLPATENEYEKGIEALESYLRRLVDTDQQDAQFYARADNLRDWLAVVEKRMGSLAQRLSASVGQQRVNVDLGGDAAATASTPRASELAVKTPWTELDDVFYEARGATWALLALLRAVQIDCERVLADKNALVSLRQIVRELESTQDTVWSPVILNGTGFGLVANHSLVMASFISRANAALIDLRRLLEQG